MTVGNDSFTEHNDAVAEEASKPKRYQSIETMRLPRTKRDNPFLFDLIKTIDKCGKSFNPLLCIDEMRILKSDPMLTLQQLHGDNSLVADAESDYRKYWKVLSVIVALEDNTTLDTSFHNIKLIIVHFLFDFPKLLKCILWIQFASLWISWTNICSLHD